MSYPPDSESDPFLSLLSLLSQTLQSAQSTLSSHRRIALTLPGHLHSTSPELAQTRQELEELLEAAEGDLADLEGVVDVLEREGESGRWCLGREEVERRRREVQRLKGEIEQIRRALALPSSSAPQASSQPSTYPPQPPSSPHPPPTDDVAEWERQQTQVYMREQDDTLDTIHGTLGTIREQANLMGREIGEQNIMLGEVDEAVDRTENKLDSAMRKMKRFVREQEDTKSSCCIGILIVILIALLLAVILI